MIVNEDRNRRASSSTTNSGSVLAVAFDTHHLIRWRQSARPQELRAADLADVDGLEVHTVGDALAPCRTIDAIWDDHRLRRDIQRYSRMQKCVPL